MAKVLSTCLLIASIGSCVAAFADDSAHPSSMTKEQAMAACIKKQRQVDAKVPEAVAKQHCSDTVGKEKESTGPVAGTVDPTKS